MSYRNPQIIVDRSAEIWGQTIANFGKQVSTGIDNYNAAKAKGAASLKKRTETTRLALNQSELQTQKNQAKVLSKIKDLDFKEQFGEGLKIMSSTGENNKYTNKNGKTFTIGAVAAQTAIKYNPNLDDETKEAYLAIVGSYDKYMASAGQTAASVTVNSEQIKNDQPGFMSKDYDVKGEYGEGTKNLLAVMSFNNMPLPDVDSKKTLGREYIDGQYQDTITVTSRVKKDGKMYKEWLKNGLTTNKVDGEDVSIFTQDPNDPNVMISTFKRNSDEAGEDGYGLIVKIQPKGKTLEPMQNAGYINPKTSEPTGEGFLKETLTVNKVLENGDEVTATETHFDSNNMWTNKSYRADLKSVSEGILALPMDQQIKYIGNNLGWGDEIDAETWQNSTDEQKTSFIELNRFNEDVRVIMGHDAKTNPIKSRIATEKDAEVYAKNNPDDKTPVKAGESTVFFTETVKAARKAKATPVAAESAADRFNTIMSDPADAMEVAGISGDYDSETGIISYEEEVDTLEDYITTKGKKAQRKVTTMEPATLDLNKKKDLQQYVNIIVNSSGSGKSKKALATKRMVKKYINDKNDQKSYQDLLKPPSKKPVYNPSTGEFN